MISAMMMVRENKTDHVAHGTLRRDAGGRIALGYQGAITAAMNVLGPPHGVKGKGWSLLLTVGLLALTLMGIGACAAPALRPATPAGTGAIVQEAPGLRVSVQAEAWQGGPRSLTDHVLPFLVILRNTGLAQVGIARTDFSLLDDANRQYLPLAPTEVVSIMGGRASGTSVYPSVGVSGSTGGSTAFGLGLGMIFGGYGTDTRDIIPQALADGPIQPGAEVRGFVYFPLPAPGYKSLRLVFAPRDPPGQPRLDFEFRPAAQ
jgi:hypothetical protein